MTKTKETPAPVLRYLEGHPKQIRCDLKAGNFNINGRTTIGETLEVSPIAWRFFEDEILGMGLKTWVEIFFIHENALAAILFHTYSCESLESLMADLFYVLPEGVNTMDGVKFTVTLNAKKNKQACATYYIANFENFEVLPIEEIEAKRQLASSLKIYRAETYTPTCQMGASHGYHLPSQVASPELAEAPAANQLPEKF